MKPAAVRSCSAREPRASIPVMMAGSRLGLSGSRNGGTKKRSRAALLVDVPVDLREPALVELAGHELRLQLGQHEPVAGVVVPGVELVQPQQAGGLVLGPHRAPVPVHDLVQTVGVEGREQDHHAALASGAVGLLVGGGEPPGELHPELGACDLGGVHGAGDREDDRALSTASSRASGSSPGGRPASGCAAGPGRAGRSSPG